MTVTCKTVDCENQGIPIEITPTWSDSEGVEQPVTTVQCGVCGEYILGAPDE